MTQTAGLTVEIQDRTRAGAIAAGKSFNKIERGAKGAGRAVGGMEKSMRSLAKVAVGGMGLAAAARGLKDATKAALEFGKSMAEISTLISGNVTAKMAELTTATERMSTAFGQDVNTEAKALYGIISAGANAGAEATNILMVANKLAVGGVTDVATAADGLTSTLNAYGLSAGDAMAVSDDLFAAMKAGKTTIGELAAGMSNIAPIAAQTGVSLEEVLAATAALTLTGEPTQRAMRGLAQVIAMTIKPTGEASVMAEKLRETYDDFEFSAAALKRLGLAGFLESITQATGGSTEKMAQLFGGVEALKPILALTGTQAESFRQIFETMAGNVDDTSVAFDKMAETEFFRMAQLEQSFASMERGVGSFLLTTLASPIQNLNDDMETFNKLVGSGMGKLEAFGRMFSGAMLRDVGFEPDFDLIPTVPPPPAAPPSAGPIRFGTTPAALMAETVIDVQRGPEALVVTEAARIAHKAAMDSRKAADHLAAMQRVEAGEFDAPSGPVELERDFDAEREDMMIGAEMRLAQRRADLIGAAESMTVRHSQEVLKWQAEIGTGDKVRMKQLTDIHDIERKQLNDKVEADEKAPIDAGILNRAKQAEDDRMQIINESLYILGRVNPKLAEFGTGIAQLFTGDIIGGVFAGINMALGEIMGASKPINDMTESIRKLKNQVREFTDDQRNILDRLSPEFTLAQRQGMATPINEFIDQWMATTGLSLHDAVRTVMRQGLELDIAGRDTGGGLSAIIEAQFGGMGNVEGFLASIQRVFGPDATFADAIESTLELRGAFEDFGGEIDSLGDRMDDAGTRARRLRFTGEEITARTRAAEQFRLAGSDIFLQKAALEELSDTIASIQAAERLSIAAVAAAASGTGTGTGDTGAGTGEVSDVVDIDPDSRLDIDLTDRIDFDPFVVTDYRDIIDVSSAVKIRKDWPDAIVFINKYGPSLVRRFTGWSDVISTTHVRGLSKIEKDWPDAITLINKYGPSDVRSFTGWHDVISLIHVENLPPIEKNWDDAIHLTEIIVSDFNSLITFNQYVTAVPVAFDKAFALGDKVVTNWSGMISSHQNAARAWIDLSQVVRFYGAGAALYRAMRGVRARVDVELSFNTSSDIREQIEAIVNDAMRDGRVSTTQTFGRGSPIGDRGF